MRKHFSDFFGKAGGHIVVTFRPTRIVRALRTFFCRDVARYVSTHLGGYTVRIARENLPATISSHQ